MTPATKQVGIKNFINNIYDFIENQTTKKKSLKKKGRKMNRRGTNLKLVFPIAYFIGLFN